MILIVTNTQDLTSDFVVRELRNRNLDFCRLNTDEFPRFATGVIAAGAGDPERAEIRWTNRQKILRLNDVKSVLYRRPVPPVPHDAVKDKALRSFCIAECNDFVRGLLFSLDCHWISHPEAIRTAEHKIYQMHVAQKLGVKMPRTLVSNDPEEIRSFFDLCFGKIVAKCVYMGFIDGPSPAVVFTSLVSRDDLNDIEFVRCAPCIFQEYVDKDFDVRVTVVGERVFVAKIEATALPPGIPDWRACRPEDLRHSPYSLPEATERQCRELVGALGLDFGAIDFAVSRQSELFFLEINPNGQWAWLETLLGFPISAALVDRLAGAR